MCNESSLTPCSPRRSEEDSPRRNCGVCRCRSPHKSIVELFAILENSERPVKITFLGFNYYGGPGDSTKTAEEQEWTVNIEITAPILFESVPLCRPHDEPMPQAVGDILRRLSDVCKN